MVKKRIKQLNKFWNILDLEKIISDIINWELDKYDIKKINWYDNLFRLRKWKLRVIFKKWDITEIVNIDTR